MENVKWEVKDNKLEVERVVSDGREIIELPLPALLTVSSEIGNPRYPTVRKVMAASKTQVPVWNAHDIGAEPSKVGQAGARTTMVKLFTLVREPKCEFVEGETSEEAGANLAYKLKEAELI